VAVARAIRPRITVSSEAGGVARAGAWASAPSCCLPSKKDARCRCNPVSPQAT